MNHVVELHGVVVDLFEHVAAAHILGLFLEHAHRPHDHGQRRLEVVGYIGEEGELALNILQCPLALLLVHGLEVAAV